MKTIPVEQLDERLAKALEQQGDREAIGLTKDAGTVAWVLRVPEALRDTEADFVAVSQGPDGPTQLVVQLKRGPRPAGEELGTPSFGAGRGTLELGGDDDDGHLRDFREYME